MYTKYENIVSLKEYLPVIQNGKNKVHGLYKYSFAQRLETSNIKYTPEIQCVCCVCFVYDVLHTYTLYYETLTPITEYCVQCFTVDVLLRPI